jgi:exopolysaccharide biosynthesis protein
MTCIFPGTARLRRVHRLRERRGLFSWLILFITFSGATFTNANVVVTPWVPIFKGIERAIGTNFPPTTYTNNGVVYTDNTLQVANCLRIDLHDPDVQLFPTPRATNYIAESSETQSISVSNFVKKYDVQVATVANFYLTSQGTDPSVEGLPSQVYGLSMCTGSVVSVPDFGPDSNNRWASLLFTTNKTPILALGNAPPGTNLAGIYNAVSGYYPVLTNGVIIGATALIAAYPDPTFHQLQPRTLFGLSADRRYLFMMIIDGRQPGYSQGANDNDMGFWLLQFGAVDGIAMDGGGSAAMYMADCSGGNPIPIGKSSYVPASGRERITGSQLGVYALPLSSFVSNVVATPGSVSAIITWDTLSNATSQVEYGVTPALGTLTSLDTNLVTSHAVNLGGLLSGKRYYYRVLSIAGETQHTSTCSVLSFTTTNFAGGTLLPLNAHWRYTTNNLDGLNWMAPGYNDSGWSNGVACLWADSRNPVPSTSTNTIPNFASGTRMPIDPATTYPFVTYYFRTQFNYTNTTVGLALTFSNFVDDGAVFYLNGFEIFRTNMPAGVITNTAYTPAGTPCSGGNATCPLVFTLTGSALSNFVVGTNVIAAEAHNFRSLGSGIPSPDVTFESAVHFTLPPPVEPPSFFTNIVVAPGEDNAVFTWTTLSNSTAQIFYGTTPLLGSASPIDPNLTLNHALVLTGLQAVTTYYYRLVSSNAGTAYSFDGTFSTVPFFLPLVTGNNVWRYTTNNLTATNWTSPIYDDSGWLGEGPALLYLENNVGVSPRVTPVPAGAGGLPMRSYYFRTHFNFSGATDGFALLFTNYIDDGAAFYLNGREVQRVRMNPGPIGYADFSSGCPINSCEATADVPDVFRISGDALTNLVEGDNLLAAEVHQHDSTSSDIVFGSTVALVRSLVTETPLHISQSNNVICVSWAGVGFTLQQTNVLGGANWPDLPGPVKTSPYCLTNPAASTFFRLRN